ncbi:hypothetical protein DSOUD_2385 [Desulfuromonas soudanensis]|uniref:DUF2336 domain-containing protein n=1 Tax=Desulfuromonas soudanensis TaxID=1603606 RepID=A0A0M4D2E7_9BACT|nr:hypothetical protein [Desulfuromonas soudanensis]ALC17146.1 hypothetical protein DSOUD_2385 [Desulfuromonas soudanensis]
MTSTARTVRLKVSPQVARIVTKGAPREVQLNAARGALPLQGQDLLTTLLFLSHGTDTEIKSLAGATLREIPPGELAPVVENSEIHPQLLDFVARARIGDLVIMEPLLTNPAVSTETLVHVASHGEGGVLSLVAHLALRQPDSPEIAAAILGNPRADRAVKDRLEPAIPSPASAEDAADADGEPEESGDEAADDSEEMPVDEEEVNLSKYQQALEMGISEKIKMALTGDKEWRNIFIKDANKLVSSAVLKNPRVTEGEVLMIAKNKSSSEELIRLITLEREWVKQYEIKRALVLHPRTPLPKALRYMGFLTEKDLKNLAKSRGVAQALVNNARRMLADKNKKKG